MKQEFIIDTAEFGYGCDYYNYWEAWTVVHGIKIEASGGTESEAMDALVVRLNKLRNALANGTFKKFEPTLP